MCMEIVKIKLIDFIQDHITFPMSHHMEFRPNLWFCITQVIKYIWNSFNNTFLELLHFTTLCYTITTLTTLCYTITTLTTLCYTLLHFTTLYYTLLHFTTLYYTLLHFTTLCYTLLHFTTLCYTLLHFATLYYTFLHNFGSPYPLVFPLYLENKYTNNLGVIRCLLT